MLQLWLGCIVGLLLLTGCSKVKENLKPVELTEFKTTVHFKKAWSKSIGKGQDDRYERLTPLLHNNTLYVVDVTGDLYAVDPDTGKTRWRVATDSQIGGGVGYAENTLLLGTLKGEVLALAESNGELKWRTQISSEVLSSPSGNGEVVVAQAIDGRVFALNLADGQIRWSYDHTVPVLTLRAQASPVVVEQNAYVAFDNGQILAFNSSTGQLRWSARVGQPKGKTDIERLVDSDTTPIVSGPFVYGAGFQSRVVAINRGTGRLNWAQEVSTFHHMIEAAGKIVVVDEDSHIKVFDAATGALSWESDKLHRRAISAPGVVDDKVVVVDFEGYIHALDINSGEFVARSNIQSPTVYAQPITHNKRFILVDRRGKVSAFSFFDSAQTRIDQNGNPVRKPANERMGRYKK